MVELTVTALDKKGQPVTDLRLEEFTVKDKGTSRTGVKRSQLEVEMLANAQARRHRLSFFDTLKHEWLVRFLEHRVADRRVVRLIQKWLDAGVLEEGHHIVSEVGTVQGGSISPLLANVYLHYVFDRWAQQWRKRQAHGDVVVVRVADDFVVGFVHQDDAAQFLAVLRERVARFGLALHPDKTRLLAFGRHAASNRRARGEGKPESFNFLGFTHSCATTRKGGFTVLRRTMRTRRQAKRKAVKIELRRRMHRPLPELGA